MHPGPAAVDPGVKVEWRAFELDPSAESAPAGEVLQRGEYARRLAAEYGTSVEQAQGVVGSMTETAAAEGLELHFERAVRADEVEAAALGVLERAWGDRQPLTLVGTAGTAGDGACGPDGCAV